MKSSVAAARRCGGRFCALARGANEGVRIAWYGSRTCRRRLFARAAHCGVVALAVAATLVAGSPALMLADTYTWNADGSAGGAAGGNGTWDTTSALWDLAGVMQAWPNTTSDTAVFAGNVGTVNLSTPITAGGLTFNTSGYVIAGNTLTLGGATPTVTVTNLGTLATIQSNLELGANATLGGPGNLALSTGVISDGGSNFGITKVGAGTLRMSGVNTFGGAVAVNGGTLSFSASSHLGSAGAANTLALAGGTLQFTGATAVDLTANRTLAMGTGGGVISVTGAGALTLSGAITGSGNLTKAGAGAGALILTANSSTYSGAVRVNAGTLQMNGVTADLSAINGLSFGGLGTFRYDNTGATGTLNNTLVLCHS